MKFRIIIAGLGLLMACKTQKPTSLHFEGEITYALTECTIRDSANYEERRGYLPQDTMNVIFRHGDFCGFWHSRLVEYSYLRLSDNKIYHKIPDRDSVIVESGSHSLPGSTILDVVHKYNTDTIMGYLCNRLEIKYEDHTSILCYSPEISTDPELYKNTRNAHFNVIYRLMKAYYLYSRYDSKDISYTLTAVRIQRKEIPDEAFPDVDTHEKLYVQ